MEYWDEALLENLLNARDKQKTILEVQYRYNSFFKGDLSELEALDNVHNGVKDFFTTITNGLELNWKKEKNGGIGGGIKIIEGKYLFADPKDSGIYDDGDDEELQYFHPLDYPSAESGVGFIIKPDTIYKTVYYLSSDYELYDLDLDYEGYTKMALEARIFNHWQVVLLHYMEKISIGASETETFKAEMPKIFTDWTWENFIAKFETLRLSNK